MARVLVEAEVTVRLLFKGAPGVVHDESFRFSESRLRQLSKKKLLRVIDALRQGDDTREMRAALEEAEEGRS